MPFALTPAITIGIAIAIAVLSFGAGFTIEHWRNGAEIERLEGTNSKLTTANGQCASDIKSAKEAITAMTAVAVERERQAAEAMRQIQPEVQVHAARITKIKALPEVAVDRQCEAIKQEQIEYVKERRK
jgi:hypothetical protein